MRPLLVAVSVSITLAATAVRADTDVALLASSTVGDAHILPVASRGAVAPVLSFMLALVAPETTSALTLEEGDRAALLRAENALSRMGRPAVEALAAELANARGARRQVLARALGVATERASRDYETARFGARALAAHPAVLVSEHLLFSGRTTEPFLDPESLPRVLGALAPASLSALAELGDREETRALAVRALAHARTARDEAAAVLGTLLARAKDPSERARVGRALSELGGEAAVLALEKGLLSGPLDEARDRIVEIEATRDPGIAPRVLARALDRLSPDDQARALEAIAVCALPPPPPPKARFVFDPHARRRTKDAREARAIGREASLARVESGTAVVRRAAARVLEALGRPDAMKDQQALARRLLGSFERERALGVACEEARALVTLAPGEVLAPAFRAGLDRVLGSDGEPALASVSLGDGTLVAAPREAVDAAARDRYVHAVLAVLGDEDADLAPLARVVQESSVGPSARARAAAALPRLGAAGRAKLDELGRSEDSITRACAATASAGALSRGQLDLYFEGSALGRSPRPLERRANVAILAFGAGKLAQGAVQSIARNDPSPLVRIEGTEALARVYGKPVAGIVAQALFDASPAVRRAAARAVGRLDDPNVGGSLCQAVARAKKLADPDQAASEERTLREALAALGKDSVPSIGNIAVNAGDPLERRVAIAQLGRIATDEAIAYLMVIVRGPKSPEDRDAAAWALERATGRDLTDSMWTPLRPNTR